MSAELAHASANKNVKQNQTTPNHSLGMIAMPKMWLFGVELSRVEFILDIKNQQLLLDLKRKAEMSIKH